MDAFFFEEKHPFLSTQTVAFLRLEYHCGIAFRVENLSVLRTAVSGRRLAFRPAFHLSCHEPSDNGAAAVNARNALLRRETQLVKIRGGAAQRIERERRQVVCADFHAGLRPNVMRLRPDEERRDQLGLLLLARPLRVRIAVQLVVECRRNVRLMVAKMIAISSETFTKIADKSSCTASSEQRARETGRCRPADTCPRPCSPVGRVFSSRPDIPRSPAATWFCMVTSEQNSSLFSYSSMIFL